MISYLNINYNNDVGHIRQQIELLTIYLYMWYEVIISLNLFKTDF